MNKDNMKNTVIKNLFWKFAERIGAQLVTFIVSIFIARILTPEDYGVVAIVLIFINIADVLVISGFNSALVQKKDADNVDFSSVFYFNILFSLILYVMIYLLSPYISVFFHNDLLKTVIRVLALRIPISAVNSVQQAYVSKHLLFKKFFASTLGGTVFSAIIGVVMAYQGFGVWALVAQYLTNTTVNTIVLWFTVKWRPQRHISVRRLKTLIHYGWKLLFSSILDVSYTHLNSLIIGRWYTKEDLAFYNKGQQFPQLVITNINTSISSVLFPVLAMKQDDLAKVKNMMRKAITTSSYVVLPCMVGLAMIAKPVVITLLTEKWIPAVPFLQTSCIVYALWPIHTSNLEAIRAVGRSDIFLKLEIAKKAVGIIILLLVMRYGVLAIALGTIASSFLGSVLNALPNKRLFHYGYLEQIKDIMPTIASSAIMGMVIFPFSYTNLGNIQLILVQVTIGCVVYILASKLLHIESYTFLTQTFRQYFKKRKYAN